MAVAKEGLVKGGIYITPTDQLRKITEIDGDKVHYKSKSAKISRRDWGFSHPKTSPPSSYKFGEDVDHQLTGEEIDKLITSGVLTAEDRK